MYTCPTLMKNRRKKKIKWRGRNENRLSLKKNLAKKRRKYKAWILDSSPSPSPPLLAGTRRRERGCESVSTVHSNSDVKPQLVVTSELFGIEFWKGSRDPHVAGRGP